MERLRAESPGGGGAYFKDEIELRDGIFGKVWPLALVGGAYGSTDGERAFERSLNAEDSGFEASPSLIE